MWQQKRRSSLVRNTCFDRYSLPIIRRDNTMPEISDSDPILGELDRKLDDLFGKDQAESRPV